MGYQRVYLPHLSEPEALPSRRPDPLPPGERGVFKVSGGDSFVDLMNDRFKFTREHPVRSRGCCWILLLIFPSTNLIHPHLSMVQKYASLTPWFVIHGSWNLWELKQKSPFPLKTCSREKRVRSILLALLTLCHSFKTCPQVFPRNGLAINKNYRERSLMLRK